MYYAGYYDASRLQLEKNDTNDWEQRKVKSFHVPS